MLGGNGLSQSTNVALLNANYMAQRLAGYYTIRFKNTNGRVAHELLIDLVEFDKAAGLKVTDFAKRLQVSRSNLLIVIMKLSHALMKGLRIPPTNLLVAHLDVYAHRTYGV